MPPRKKQEWAPTQPSGVIKVTPTPPPSNLPPRWEYMQKDLPYPLSVEELSKVSGDNWAVCGLNRGRDGHTFMYNYLFRRPAPVDDTIEKYLAVVTALKNFRQLMVDENTELGDHEDMIRELCTMVGITL